MTLAYSTVENAPLVRLFLVDQLGSSAVVNANIDARDEMYQFAYAVHGQKRDIAVVSYLRTGLIINRILSQIVKWRFKGNAGDLAYLDFACGYGRSTRFLAQEIPPGQIWGSDIYADAVRFQTEEFGVHGIVSVTHPDDYPPVRHFDCILVASLFSHLPASTFVPWLHKLYSLLAPQGILLFSVHDEAILPPNLQMPHSGFCFVGTSESQILAGEEYGSAWVTEEFVSQAIAGASAGQAKYHRIKRGLAHVQDLYLLVNDQTVEFGGLDFDPGPQGFLDRCVFAGPDLLSLRGWAATDSPTIYVSDVQILINGQLRQRCLPFAERPDVAHLVAGSHGLYAGWDCFCRLPAGTRIDQDVLMVKAVANSGTEYVMHFSTLADALTADELPQPAQAARRRRGISGLM